jgi:aminoglycoside 6'-N-acetyltransferase
MGIFIIGAKEQLLCLILTMIVFDPLTLKEIPLMYIWFNEPHVQEFYSLRKWSEQEVLEKLSPQLPYFLNRSSKQVRPKQRKKISVPANDYPSRREKPLFGFVIKMEEVKLGYIQYYSLQDYPWSEQDLNDDIVKRAVGIDLFIGEPSWVGKGLGQKIVTSFLNKFIWPDFEYCFVDPNMRNLASIRMFQKCGFKDYKNIRSIDALGHPVTLCLMRKQRDAK